MKIFPSVASSDVLSIAHEIDRLEGWPLIHFDVEDGNFTPNITFGQKMMKAVGQYIRPRALDVHLMVTDPCAFLEPAARSGAGSICAHIEALRFPLLFLNKARAIGMKAGLALNIGTPLEAVRPFLANMDYLLVMTSEPDACGEELYPAALEKAVEAARTLPIEVMADGGLNGPALDRLARAGCAGCVLGRMVFRSEDPARTLAELKERYRAER